MNGARVPVGRFLIALAGGEVDGAGDLLIEEDVFHGLGAIGVEADGELADVARPRIGVEHFVEGLGVGGGGFHDLAVLEDQTHVGVRDGPIGGRAIVMNHAIDGSAHRRRIYFSIGDIALAVAFPGGDALDGK